MGIQEKVAEYLVMQKHETVYKDLYENNPSIYFYEQCGRLYMNWEDFADYYRKTVHGNNVLIPDAPTLFAKEITETDFFADKEMDVDIVFNSRYCPPFWHDLKFIKIMYVLNGEFELNLSMEKSIKLTKGNFIIVPPYIMQSVFSYHDNDVVVNIFLKLSTFEKAFASILMEAEEISKYFWQILYGRDENNIILFQCGEVDFLSQLVVDLAEERKSGHQGGNFLLISYVMTFIAYALVHLREFMTPVTDARLCKTELPEMIQYIRENYNTVTLGSLAERFDRNESYLSRYIKSETGYSFVQLLKRYRMKQAGMMLRETDCSIETIMLDVGYSDISYFYKVFKKFYGTTPKEYREIEKILISY